MNGRKSVLHNNTLSFGLGLVFQICSLTIFAAAQDPQTSTNVVRVGPSVQVSNDLSLDPHYEMEIAANPEDSRELIACSMLFANISPTTDVVTYVSLDGGRTWKLTLRTKGEGPHPSWDPDCKYGSDHVAYSLSEGLGLKSTYNRIDRSLDGGRTWESSFRTVHSERAFLTVDRNESHRGWLFLHGAVLITSGTSPGVGPHIDWSPDQGKTFFSQDVPLKNGENCVGLGPAAILSDGSFVFPMAVTGGSQQLNEAGKRRSLEIVRAKFERPNWPLTVETISPGQWFINDAPTGSILPSMAVDSGNGPFRDRLYLVWEDGSSGSSLIKLSFSDDAKTWSRPRVINDEIPIKTGDAAKALDDLHGVVAVNNQGVVGVMWFDRRSFPGNLGWTARFRASLDGGETFLPSVKLSNMDYDPARRSVIALFPTDNDWHTNEALSTNELRIGAFTFSGGHTMGLTADTDGEFHPLWLANPKGVPQMWTTNVLVQGRAERNGNAELAQLKDASKLIRLEFLNRFYNLKSHVLDFDLQLENVSQSQVAGPVKVRVLNIGSQAGPVLIKADDKDGIVEGALLDFSSLLPGGVLKPGDKTKSIHFRLDVQGADPINLSSLGYIHLADLTTKVLAGSIETPKESAREK